MKRYKVIATTTTKMSRVPDKAPIREIHHERGCDPPIRHTHAGVLICLIPADVQLLSLRFNASQAASASSISGLVTLVMMPLITAAMPS